MIQAQRISATINSSGNLLIELWREGDTVAAAVAEMEIGNGAAFAAEILQLTAAAAAAHRELAARKGRLDS